MVLGIAVGGSRSQSLTLLERAQQQWNATNVRLATLRRINQGSDDPAGLILVESLNNQIAAQEAALSSTSLNQAWAAVADSGLSHASDLLASVQSSLVTAANDTLSADQRDALQIEIDASLDALARIGQTSWGGSTIFGETSTFVTGASPESTASLALPALDDALGGASGTLSDVRSGGAASLASGDLETTAAIVEEARQQVLSARVSLGTFQRSTLDSTSRVLESSLEVLSSARSAVQDADLAEELSASSRFSVLTKLASTALIRSFKQRQEMTNLLIDSVGTD